MKKNILEENLEHVFEEISSSNKSNFVAFVNVVNQPDNNTGNQIRRSMKKKIESINGCIKDDTKRTKRVYFFYLDTEQAEIEIDKKLQLIYSKTLGQFVKLL